MRVALFVAWFAAGCAGEAARGRPWVRHFDLREVRQVDEKELRAKLVLHEASPFWWLPLVPKNYLDPFTFRGDQARIEAYYRSHGFFSARVTSAEPIRRTDDSVDVRITVEEGAPTAIRSVRVSGIAGPAEERAWALRHLHLAPGERFDHPVYLAQKESLAARLRSLGYAWAVVDGSVAVDRDSRKADVALRVTTGPRATVGEVRVRGLVKVDAGVVIRRAGLRAGERFDPAALDDARDRVESLRLFSSVAVTWEHAASRPDVADVVVTVQEASMRELRLGVGLGIEPQRMDVHGQVSHSWRNFLGGARTLKLQTSFGWVALPTFWQLERNGPIASAELSLTQLDRPFRLSQVTFTVGWDLGIEYAFQYQGPRTQLGITQPIVSDRLRVGLSYNFQYLDFFNVDPTLTCDPKTAGQLYGYVAPYLLGWFQEDIVLDLRDRPLDPHRGIYAAVSVEEPGGAFLYEKVVPDVRTYLPVGKRIVLAGRVQFGQLFTQGDLGSPITRRFYLGGPGSHRGFTYNRLSPQVASGLANVPPIPIGGDQMLLIQAEVRADLFHVGASSVGAVAFFDAGDVAQANRVSSSMCPPPDPSLSYPSIEVERLHLAAGGGLRLKTELGTLRFDVGVRLNRVAAPNPDAGQWGAVHLSLGEAF